MFNQRQLVDLILRNTHNGVLTIPQNVTKITADIGKIIREFDVSQICFEKDSLLTEVEQSAFQGNSNICSIDFSQCEHLLSLGKESFAQTSALKSIIFAPYCNIKTIEDGAFLESGVDSINLEGANLTILKQSTFMECPNLKEIILKNCKQLTEIESGVFGGCPQMQLIDLSGTENLKTFGGNNLTSDIVRYDYNWISADKEVTVFNSTGVDRTVEIWDNGKLAFSFNSDDEKYTKLSVMGLGLLKFANRIGFQPQSNLFFQLFANKKQLQNAIANYDKINTLFGGVAENYNEKLAGWKLLKSLGYFNDDVSEVDKETRFKHKQYKVLLSADYLKHNPTVELSNAKTPKEAGDVVQKTSQKYATEKSLQELALAFVKNNVLPHPEAHKLLKEWALVDQKANFNVNFAMFFVRNFDEIMQKLIVEMDTSATTHTNFNLELRRRLPSLFADFEKLLKRYPQKAVLSRSQKQRFTLDFCGYEQQYDSVTPETTHIAKLCASQHLQQESFETICNLIQQAKKTKANDFLCVIPDDKTHDIHYEFLERDNPLAYVVGDITNCCQSVEGSAKECVCAVAENNCTGIVTFNKGEEIIGQSFVWYDPKTKTFALDNIEVPRVFDKQINGEKAESMLHTIKRLCQNFKTSLDASGNTVNNIIIGVKATDVDALKTEYEIENNPSKMLKRPVWSKAKNALMYTDVVDQGQYVVMRDGKWQHKQKEKNVEVLPER